MVRFGRRLILILMLGVWAGAVFLTNPGPPPADPAPDLRPWPEGSVLKRLLEASCLDYRWPTESHTQIKALVLRAGATAMAVAAMVCWGLSVRRRRESGWPGGPSGRAGVGDGVGAAERDALVGRDAGRDREAGGSRLFGRPIAWRHPGPLEWSLLLLGGWMAWATASAGWSHAPREAIGYVEQFAFVVAVAVVAALSLDRRLARAGAVGWLVLAACVAGLGVWYHQQRGPLRPLAMLTGETRELAGLMLPAVVLAVVLAVGRVAEWVAAVAGRDREGGISGGSVVALVALLAVAGGGVWATRYCATGAWQASGLAMVAGGAVAAVVVARGRWRLVWVVVGVLGLLWAGWGGARGFAAGGRPIASPPDVSTVLVVDKPLVERDRWSFALELFARRPAAGHGGWGYRLLADEVAARRALADPRWSGRPVGPAGSFWLEQLVDLGLIGAGLLAGALLLLVVAAGRAAGRCPWRRHRWLIAGLAGGLAALAVHELFASSTSRHAFAALLAGWAGLTAASARWSTRPVPPAGQDEYRLGFYPGGLTFLVGAAVVLSTIGYIVAADWRAARGYYLAVHEDIPEVVKLRREIVPMQRQLLSVPPALFGSPQVRALVTALPRKLDRQNELQARAEERLIRAVHWSIDPRQRLSAMWQRAWLSVGHIEQLIDQESVRVAGDRRAGPVPVTRSASWVQELEKGPLRIYERLGRIHPQGRRGLKGTMARVYLLMARGRHLSYLGPRGPNQVVLSEIVRAVNRAAALLDAELNEDPGYLPDVLLRESLGDKFGLAAELKVPVSLATWLLERAAVRQAPGDRLALLRDGLRDYGLIGADLTVWSTAPGATVGRAKWSAMPPLFYDALARVERDLSLADPAGRMLEAARWVEAGRADDWPRSSDPDIRGAPQTFRLLAELALLRNFASGRAGLAGGADGDLLKQADDWLARAGRLYDQAPDRFAVQRVAVALQHAQLAWQTDGGGSAGPLAFVEQARGALGRVDTFHRRSAGRAIAAVSAFLLAEAGRAESAMQWYVVTGYLQGGTLEKFRREVARGWRSWLAPQPVVRQPAPHVLSDQPDQGGRPGPTTRPDERPLWPIRLRPIESLLGL